MNPQQRANFTCISTEGDFSLYADSPIYKTYGTTHGYIKNTKTGENCGKEVHLRKHYYVDGELLDEPLLDEDCYEFVFGGEDDE